MTVSVIVVNWNGAHLLRDCLQPLCDEVDGIEVIVVDNGSADGSVDLLRAEFPAVTLIANPDNRGFAAANNQGIGAAKERYALLLNNDTIPDPRAIHHLTGFLDERPAVAIAGPTLVNVDGSAQDSCGPGPNLVTELLGKSMLHRLLPGRRSWAPAENRKVDWVTGAALCIRREVAMDLGGLDEQMFMFYEDLDLCARAREWGHEVWFVATPPIVHLGGATRRTVEARSLVDSYRSTDRYFRVHGPTWRHRLIRLLTLPEMVARGLLWSVLLVVPRKRVLAKARLDAYRQICGLALLSR